MSLQSQMERPDRIISTRISAEEDAEAGAAQQRADAARDRARADSEARRLIAERYDPAFAIEGMR